MSELVSKHVGYAIPDDILSKMKELRYQGYTNADIAKLTGYHVNTVIRRLGNQPRGITEISFIARAEFERVREARRKEYAQKQEEVIKARLKAEKEAKQVIAEYQKALKIYEGVSYDNGLAIKALENMQQYATILAARTIETREDVENLSDRAMAAARLLNVEIKLLA